jgi:hypothetical protein
MTLSLAALPKGHEFVETRIKLTSEWVAGYVRSVEDDAIGSVVEFGFPPLALAACSIRALLDQAALPDGAIHVGQELSFSLNRDTESEVVARARVASRGERQGWVLMGIELSVESESGAAMMSGRATITFPVSGGPAG